MPSPENRFLAMNIHVSYEVNIITKHINMLTHNHNDIPLDLELKALLLT